jgi:hypothetical protein
MNSIITDLHAVERLTVALQNDCRNFTKRRGRSPQTMMEIMQSLATVVALYTEAAPELKTYFDQAFRATLAEFAREQHNDAVANH